MLVHETAHKIAAMTDLINMDLSKNFIEYLFFFVGLKSNLLLSLQIIRYKIPPDESST